MADDTGPKLWIAFAMAVLGSAFTFGWNIGVTNLPEPFIRCWIQESLDEEQFAEAGVNCSQARDASSISKSSNGTWDTDDDSLVSLREIMDKSTKLWALCTSIFAIGAMIGSLLGGPMSDKLGRRMAMIVNAVLAGGSCLLLGACRLINNYPVFVIGRVLIGVSCGISSTVAPTYLSEIAPESKKGVFGTSFQLGVTIGIVVAQIFGLEWILGTNDNWPWALALGAAPAVLQILLGFISPESPSWLAGQGDIGDATKALLQLQGKNAVLEVAQEKSAKSSLIQNVKSIFASSGPKNALITVCMYMIIQQLSGINAIFFYSTSIFISAGIPVEWSGICSVGLSTINVLGVFAAVALIDKKGRLFLFFWSVAVMCVMCVLTTVLLSFPDNQTIAYMSVLSVFIYVFFFEIGAGPIPWMMAGEYMPTQYSAGTAAIGASTNWFCCFIVGLAFPPLQDALDQYVFVIFGVICGLGAVYIKLRGIESKGKTVEQIQTEFSRR